MMKAPLLSKLYLVALIMINAPYSTDLQAQLLVEGEQDLSGLHTYRDINYIESAIYADDKDKLDIFMPEGQKDIPVILFFHGGALKAGTKLDGEALAARMKGFGIGVVSAITGSLQLFNIPDMSMTPLRPLPGRKKTSITMAVIRVVFTCLDILQEPILPCYWQWTPHTYKNRV